jgi:hypothetical protein
LKLGIFQHLRIPSAEHFGMSDYQDYIGQVDYYRAILQIRHARRVKGYSVRFDDKTKRIVTHHLSQVREIILKLEVDDWKKESLLTCVIPILRKADSLGIPKSPAT